MRISDWSSDVCSSDLVGAGTDGEPADVVAAQRTGAADRGGVEDVGGVQVVDGLGDGAGDGADVAHLLEEVVRIGVGADAHVDALADIAAKGLEREDRKSTRLNSSH